MEEYRVDSEYLKIVFKALSDTLLEYLLPGPVINASQLLKSQSKDFLEIDGTAENRELTDELIHHLMEDESDEAPLAVELKQVLCDLHNNSINDYVKVGEKYDAQTISNTFMEVLNGSFLKDLSMEEAGKVCTFMCEKKFITEKTCKLAVKKSTKYEICFELIKNIKSRKPDWPFEFLDYIKSIKAIHFVQVKDISAKQEPALTNHPVADDMKAALDCLDDGSALSSKFSEVDIDYIINKKLMKEEEKHMTYFSDESGDDLSDDDVEDSNEQATMDLSLRNYQKELAKNALHGKNTIICAPTGSGKTRVATHVIIEHLKKRKAGNLKTKIAFLARTVPLAMQQFKGLKQFLPLKYQDKIESVTGDSEYSMSLHKIFNEYDVFVMTPRILENHVQGDNPLIPGGVSAFSLLVFDECHHTRKGEAYNSLMLSYLNTKEKSPHDLPQVVGLTASIGVEKAKNETEAVENILKICSNLDAVCISTVKEFETEMRQKVPVPKNETYKLKERGHDETVEKILSNIKELEARALQRIQEIKNDDLDKLIKKIPQDRKSQQYGQWVVTMEKRAMSIARQPELETNSSIRTILAIADHLKAYNVALELYDLVSWRYVLEFLTKRFSQYQERKDGLTTAEKAHYSFFQDLKHLKRDTKKGNKNLKQLKEVIKKNLLKNSEERETQDGQKEKISKGIIFVRTRFIAHALTSWMESNQDPSLKGLGTSVFTGTDAPEDEGGMTSTQQEEIIERFKSGGLRLLVATSVAEEGLDIPECNLVIKYNHVGNEVTTVQMRGRSRRQGGKSVLLAFDNMYKKELINTYDAEMMDNAIKVVSFMHEKQICRENEANQKEILQKDKIDKLMKQNAKSDLIDKDFKMVCKMCRQVVINSQDIKLIDDSHHVVASREFMNQIVKRNSKFLHATGQMTTYGKAICKGKPEKQAMCGNILGSLMIFNKIPFVVLSVKSFGFETGNDHQLAFHKSWKKVRYQIKDIQTEDIQRYLPDTKASPRKSSPEWDSTVPERRSVSDFETTNEAGSEAQGNHNAQESITHAKAVAHGSQLPGRALAATRDSGFQSVKAKENTRNSAGDESNTHPKVAPDNLEVPQRERIEEAENLPYLLHPASTVSIALLETNFSKISSCNLPPPEVIEEPTDSIPSLQFSSESEDESGE